MQPSVSKTLACRCPTESAAHETGCQRAGCLTVGRLWELCSGQCPPERPCREGLSESYRELWDGAKQRQIPRFLQRLVTFLCSWWRHARNWFRQAPTAVREARLALCRACEYYLPVYTGGRCAKCGCGIGGAVLDKTKWRSSRCPLGKW